MFSSLIPSRRRLHAATRAAAIHLLLSLVIASISATVVLGLWYPYPYRELSGGSTLFWLVVAVDVVCGPLLTLVVFSPAKTRTELVRDMSFIAVLQAAALIYGVHSAWEARPAALAFEVDRFRAVSYADMDPGDQIPPEMLAIIHAARPSVAIIGVRPPRNANEQFDSVRLSLDGLEPGQRPSWWRPYSYDVQNALRAAHSIASLQLKNSGERKALEDAILKSGLSAQELVWLPVVSRRTTEWIVLLDAVNGQPRSFAHVDGFDS